MNFSQLQEVGVGGVKSVKIGSEDKMLVKPKELTTWKLKKYSWLWRRFRLVYSNPLLDPTPSFS